MFGFYLDFWPCCQTVSVTVMFREGRMNKWFCFDSTETARCMFACVAISCTCRIHYLFPFASLLPWLPEVGNRRWINHLYRFKLNMLMSFPIFNSSLCFHTRHVFVHTAALPHRTKAPSAAAALRPSWSHVRRVIGLNFPPTAASTWKGNWRFDCRRTDAHLLEQKLPVGSDVSSL